TAWLMSVLAAIAVMLTGFGVVLIRRAVARPLAAITRVTEQVAKGAEVVIPYGARRDEIGALSRSIAVFQNAMRHNADLNRTVTQDAEARGRRQEQVSCEIVRFSAEVETSIAQLGAISSQMLTASGQLADAADRAARRTAG